MRRAVLLLAGLAALAVTPAGAACRDEIAALDGTLSAQAKTAGSATSGGQANAAERGQTAQQATKTGTPVDKLPAPPSSGNEKAAQAAADAGGGGEALMSAKVSLNDARNAEKRGDEQACLAAVAKAKAQSKN